MSEAGVGAGQEGLPIHRQRGSSAATATRCAIPRPHQRHGPRGELHPTGTETLDMLDQYIRQCDVVIIWWAT